MSSHPLTPEAFVAEWKGRNRSERAIAQTHFTRLCHLLGVPAPFENRALDDDYCFDAVTATAGSRVYAAAKQARSKATKSKRAADASLFGPDAIAPEPDDSSGGLFLDDVSQIVAAKSPGKGFADVWKRGCFCWEYKGQGDHADLDAALMQLRMYAPSLGNPPLLIVCDIDTIEIHTNFTNYPSEVYRLTLEELAHPSEEWITQRGISPINLLRAAFDPALVEKQFRPRKSLTAITEELAGRIGGLVEELHPAKTEDGTELSREELAHFLMQIVFALFAEDVKLLPDDRVTKLLVTGNQKPADFPRKIRSLFRAMESGGDFGEDTIEWFNGGLFRGVSDQKIPRLTAGQLGIFVTVGRDDWSAVEPSILGTLFERALNPQKRAHQIGAHYTSRDDIMLIIEPVVLAPLKRKWNDARDAAAALAAKRDAAKTDAAHASAQKAIRDTVRDFHDHLASITILDPACGSGNFLYVAIQCLLDMERQVIAFASRDDIGVTLKPKVSPTQLRGIEIDPYAAELARISIWIGYLKWKHDNARIGDERPILQPLDAIECRDAILTRAGKLPTPAKWPVTDFIIGNPPFLGSKMFRKWGLTDDYLKDLFASYDLPKTSDLCCYWFERARQVIEKNPGTRAGLLATQGIRGGDNRTVLERIKKTGDIFMAWSDREWVLDGAAVQVSMVGFDGGQDKARSLDGHAVKEVNADLSRDAPIGTAATLAENLNLAFMGSTKGGPFELSVEEVINLFEQPNPSGRLNAEVIVPWVNGSDLAGRERSLWIIDFVDRDKKAAVQYEKPFRLLEDRAKSSRTLIRDAGPAERWWLHNRPRPDMRQAIASLARFIVTVRVAKHRLFRWYTKPTLPDSATFVFARSDDYFFGVLHSTVHELWSLRQGTQLEDRPRYTPTSTFETFPLPWRPGAEPTDPKAKHHALWKEISAAAADLDRQREAWLNPPEWIESVARQVDIKYRDELAAVPKDVRDLVRRSAIMAEACDHELLKHRTLTNLYNQRPAWVRLAHERLDRAVLAAYAGVDPQGGWDPHWASVYEPYGAGLIDIRTTGTKKNPADTDAVKAHKSEIIAKRQDIDAKILGALLRLNRLRATAGAPRPVAADATKPKPTRKAPLAKKNVAAKSKPTPRRRSSPPRR